MRSDNYIWESLPMILMSCHYCKYLHLSLHNICAFGNIHYGKFGKHIKTYAWMSNLCDHLPISLSVCLSPCVNSNFRFHHSHKVILFISSLILYNTSYLLLLKSSSLPQHISTMSAVKVSSHWITWSFNLMVFTVSVVPYNYPTTHIFNSLVFN
jgi:hypothetical protein